MDKKVCLGIQDFPLQRVIAATLCNHDFALRLRKLESNAYIQKKVRLGIQDFPLQRVIAATLPTC